MATISPYNGMRKWFANNEVTLATIKLMLVNNHSFNPAQTDMTSITPNQVSGFGWTAGGETLVAPAVTVVNTNEAMLDANDISKTAVGGNIGPADGAVLYDSTGNEPLFYIDFQGDQEAGVGTPFNVNWHASGIHRWIT